MVNLQLDGSEALVLFEFLARFEESGTLEVDHASEERVLEKIHAALERTLVEPLSADYASLLADARATVCRRWGNGDT